MPDPKTQAAGPGKKPFASLNMGTGKMLLGMVKVTVAIAIAGTYFALVMKPLWLWYTFLWNLY